MFLVPADPLEFSAVRVFWVYVFNSIVPVNVVHRFLVRCSWSSLSFSADSLEVSFDSAETADGVNSFAHLDVVF